MGTYLFYLVVSGIPLIARIVVIAVVAEQEKKQFDWQDVLVAQQPFWFAAVLSLTALLRLIERVKEPQQDFWAPPLYNMTRVFLLGIGILAIFGAALLLYLDESGGTVPTKLTFTAAIWFVPSAAILAMTQLGIKNR